MIGILAAMEEEKNAFLANMKDVKEEKRNGILYYHGMIKDKEVVLSRCGVGKANAAMSATLMILKYKPELIVNVGSSGSLQKDVHVGDIVVCEKAAEWDMDIPADDWKRSFDCEKLSFSCDEKAVKIAKKLRFKVPVHIGNIVSGDSFIYRKSQVNTIKRFYPEALCGEMEGASIAKICDHLNTKCLVVRSISDATLVQGDYKNFDFNLELASKNSADLATKIIERYA